MFDFNFISDRECGRRTTDYVQNPEGSRSGTPNFWRQITTSDWQGAYRNLRNFGDIYPTRRNLEADLLKSSLDESGPASV